jgi:N-acetylneuraminic acid mutarotase
VFGGRDSQLLSDFYALDLKSREWKPLPKENARGRHSMTLVDEKIYLISGKGKGVRERLGSIFTFEFFLTSLLSDVGIYDTKTSTWSSVSVPSSFPPRLGHSATAIDKEIWVFGGTDGSSEFYNDVHVFDTVSGEWRVPKISGNPPSPRSSHSATNIGDDK